MKGCRYSDSHFSLCLDLSMVKFFENTVQCTVYKTLSKCTISVDGVSSRLSPYLLNVLMLTDCLSEDYTLITQQKESKEY